VVTVDGDRFEALQASMTPLRRKPFLEGALFSAIVFFSNVVFDR
jgi:hypothetical protein